MADGCEVVLLPGLEVPAKQLGTAPAQKAAKHYLGGLGAHPPGLQAWDVLDREIRTKHPEQKATINAVNYVNYDGRFVALYDLAHNPGTPCNLHIGFQVNSVPGGTAPAPYDYATPRHKTMPHYQRVWKSAPDKQVYHVVLQ